MTTIAEKLRNAPASCDGLVDYLTSILDDADEAEVGELTFSEAFLLIERNAGAHLGNPGPLVHFLERFYPRYCGHLVESVRRCPTAHTLWMLNRILNGSPSEQDRATFVRLLASVAADRNADAELQEQARGFWERHTQAG